ncbi:hypothetical protein HKX48_002865 [Thoreauomyces humboldtii]|nr:hypothetical protein HKX48_002865 [Thoreauomyces humboldtii]
MYPSNLRPPLLLLLLLLLTLQRPSTASAYSLLSSYEAAGLLPENATDYSTFFSACYTSLSTRSCVPVASSAAADAVPYGSFVTLVVDGTFFRPNVADYPYGAQFAPSTGASPAKYPIGMYKGFDGPSGPNPSSHPGTTIPLFGQLLANITNVNEVAGAADGVYVKKEVSIAPTTTLAIDAFSDPRDGYIFSSTTSFPTSGVDAVQWLVTITANGTNSTVHGYAAGSFNLSYSDPESAWGRGSPVALFGWKEAKDSDREYNNGGPAGSHSIFLVAEFWIPAVCVLGAVILVSYCLCFKRRRARGSTPRQSASTDALTKELP